jgi:hypothetical protein
VHEDEGRAIVAVLVPTAASEETNSRFDLEQAHLVFYRRGRPKASGPRPTGEGLEVAIA